MDCTQIDRALDDLMDGVLDEAQRRALDEHCAGCAECAEKLWHTRQMMRMFSEMAPEMDVPLSAQAAWRSAVKREAASAKRRRFVRMASGVAAAVAIVLGATLAFRAPQPKVASTAFDAEVYATMAPVSAEEDAADDDYDYAVAAESAYEYAAADDIPENNAVDAESAGKYAMPAEDVNSRAVMDMALIEADGAMGMAESFDMEAEESALAAGAAPMHEIQMTVEGIDRTCDYICDLVSEYEGGVDVQRYEDDGVACANLYITMPARNAGDFLKAAGHFDRSGSESAGEEFAGDGDVSLLLVLKSL